MNSRHEDHGERNQKRYPRAGNDPAQNIAAQVVGAEHVRRVEALGRFHHGGELLLVGIVRRQHRAEQAHENKNDHDGAAAKGFDVQARQKLAERTLRLSVTDSRVNDRIKSVDDKIDGHKRHGVSHAPDR